MFLTRERSMVDVCNENDVFGLLGKEKVALRDQGEISKTVDPRSIEYGNHDPRSRLTVFLTPPSSPPRDETLNVSDHCKLTDHKTFVNTCENFAEEEDAFRAWSTKDLRSMLIRDCMWNGYTLQAAATAAATTAVDSSTTHNRTESPFEKFRSLTKTPPLVDCNLRITFVDPSEIWPFNIAEQLKAGTPPRSNGEEMKTSNGESAEEDVEVDVVGLETGSSKVAADNKRKEEPPLSESCSRSKDATKSSGSSKALCDKAPSSTRQELEKPPSPLTPNTSDDEYSCKLRPCVGKRKRSTDSESDRSSVTDAKQHRASSGDESDAEGEPGRATHNVLERKRRNELKQRFQYLRDSIPELSGNDRAPKVAILQKAFTYITFLKMEEKSLLEEAQRQRNLNARLLKRVYDLKH